MTRDSLLIGGLVLLAVGIGLAFLGWFIKLLVGQSPSNKPIDLVHAGWPTKIALGAAVGGGILLGFAVLALSAAAIWWSFSEVLSISSPGKLAVYSLIIGPAPLLFTILASLIARLIGGRINASGAFDCYILGQDIGPFLYSMFMAYWLVIFTAGMSMIGLVVSAIWAIRAG